MPAVQVEEFGDIAASHRSGAIWYSENKEAVLLAVEDESNNSPVHIRSAFRNLVCGQGARLTIIGRRRRQSPGCNPQRLPENIKAGAVG